MSPSAEASIRVLQGVRREIAAQDTNYLGQEGRGAARLFQKEAIRTIDRTIIRIQQQDMISSSMRP